MRFDRESKRMRTFERHEQPHPRASGATREYVSPQGDRYVNASQNRWRRLRLAKHVKNTASVGRQERRRQGNHHAGGASHTQFVIEILSVFRYRIWRPAPQICKRLFNPG